MKNKLNKQEVFQLNEIIDHTLLLGDIGICYREQANLNNYLHQLRVIQSLIKISKVEAITRYNIELLTHLIDYVVDLTQTLQTKNNLNDAYYDRRIRLLNTARTKLNT